MLKQCIHKILHGLGYRLLKTGIPDPPPNTIVINPELYHILPKEKVTYAFDQLYSFHNCDFINDPKFRRAYELGKATDTDGTVLNGTEIYWRIYVLCWAAAQVIHLNGDFVDCGVNTGIFARAVMDYTDFAKSGKTYYLLDTFTGLDPRYSSPVEMGREMNHKYNEQRDSLYQDVQETFKGLPVKIIKGAVPDTLPEVEASRIAYLSIDMNCMQPEIDALNYFWDRIVPGGIIILDDYGYCNAYMDQKHAHDAFARSKGVEILTLPTCQGVIIKPYEKTALLNTQTELSLASIDKGHHNITYKGIKCSKAPFDYVLYQMIIHTLKPDLIIEIGANEGGSALYFADLLEHNGKGVIHTIDIADRVSPEVKENKRIQFFGDGWEAYDIALAAGFETILVIEDSSHTYENTLAAIQKFAPLVTRGSYLIVEDGIVDALGIAAEFNGGPVRAIKEFMQINDNFINDVYWTDFFGKNATFNTIGYLKKIK